MPVSKYGSSDWFAGWRVAIGDGEGWLAGVVLTDSAGNEIGTGGTPSIAGGQYNAVSPSLTTGQTAPLQLTPVGQLIATPFGVGTTPGDGVGGNSNALVIPDSSGSARAFIRVIPYNFNGATFDRPRGNTTGTIVIPPTGWQYAAATGGIVNTTTAVTIKASAGAGVRNYLSSLQINTDTLGAATEIAVRDGAGGPVLWRMKLQTPALPVTTVVFGSPLVGSAATLLEVVTLTASVTGGVFFNAQGFSGA